MNSSMAMTSKVVELSPVNEFQAVELEKHGVTERDPMFVTMATMLELEECPTPAAIRAAGMGLEAAQVRAQAIHPQLTPSSHICSCL